MAGAEHHDASHPPGGGHFATTQWSLVLSAADRSSPRARQALAELCGAYWYPLYAFVRRHGSSAAEAEDLTQAFFLALLEKEFLAATGPEKGRTHVARGGCWSSFATQCASGYRNGKAEPSQREPSYGFRVVCEIKSPQ